MASRGRPGMGLEGFLKRARQMHGDAFDYSEVDYQGYSIPVRIRCKKHDVLFQQTPGVHIHGGKCPQCLIESRRRSPEQFIAQAREKHGNKYEYGQIEYVNGKTPVTIICPKHGPFRQKPDNHVLLGSGCRMCAHGSKSEDAIARYLLAHGFTFWHSHNFPELGGLQFDFLVWISPRKFILIESDGEQHRRWIRHFQPTREDFEALLARDARKTEFARENGYILFRLEYAAARGTAPVIDQLATKLRDLLGPEDQWPTGPITPELDL